MLEADEMLDADGSGSCCCRSMLRFFIAHRIAHRPGPVLRFLWEARFAQLRMQRVARGGTLTALMQVRACW